MIVDVAPRFENLLFKPALEVKLHEAPPESNDAWMVVCAQVGEGD